MIKTEELMQSLKKESSSLKNKKKPNILVRIINFFKRGYEHLFKIKKKHGIFKNEKDKIKIQILAGIPIPENMLNKFNLTQKEFENKEVNRVIEINKLDRLLKEASEIQQKINETLKFIKKNEHSLTKEQEDKLDEIRYKAEKELLPEIERLAKQILK